MTLDFQVTFWVTNLSGKNKEDVEKKGQRENKANQANQEAQEGRASFNRPWLEACHEKGWRRVG